MRKISELQLNYSVINLVVNVNLEFLARDANKTVEEEDVIVVIDVLRVALTS